MGQIACREHLVSPMVVSLYLRMHVPFGLGSALIQKLHHQAKSSGKISDVLTRCSSSHNLVRSTRGFFVLAEVARMGRQQWSKEFSEKGSLNCSNRRPVQCNGASPAACQACSRSRISTCNCRLFCTVSSTEGRDIHSLHTAIPCGGHNWRIPLRCLLSFCFEAVDVLRTVCNSLCAWSCTEVKCKRKRRGGGGALLHVFGA